MSGGFLNDFAGAAGCDGGGNAMARGMNKMFGEVGMQGMDPRMAEQMGHIDPMLDELADPAMQDPAWQEDFFHHQAAPSHMPPGMMQHGLDVNEYLAREASQPHAAFPHAVHAHPPPQQVQPALLPQEVHAQEAQQLAAMQQTAAAVDWAAALQSQTRLYEKHPEQFAPAPQQEAQVDAQEEECLTFGIEGEEIVTFDEKQAKCGFFEFLEKVKTGEVVLEEKDDAQQAATVQEDASARLGVAHGPQDGSMHDQPDYMATANDWANQYAEGRGGEMGAEEVDWAKQYQEEYQNMNKRVKVPYEFQENNQYLYHSNPFQEGLDLLAAGTLSEAVLAFEAACQKDEEHVDAWKYLGTTQAENERDQPAIAALEQCRLLSPNNHEVLMALSVSLTNENHFTEAVEALQTWLLAHPGLQEYVERLKAVPDVEPKEEDYASSYFFVHPGQHSKTVAMFELAAELAGARHADVHIAMGVLFNMSHEYGKAVQSFEKALTVNSDDPKLWNKLGASLANGNRCSEALNAYNRALDLNPGYVRTLYNIGICYSNLGEHREAATYHLRAIQMQAGGRDGAPSGNREMWDGLRMAFSLMNRTDLVEKSQAQDVALFRDEFQIDMW